MTISVTQEDIDKAKPLNREKSPLNYSFQRTELKDKDIFVYSLYMTIHNGRYYKDGDKDRCDHYLMFPKEVIQFIYDFDGGKKVEPFEFELEYIP